jgi:hypothetical protein
MNFQRDITLVSPGGTKRSATVSCHARHWNEGSFSRRECTIQLRAEGFDIHSAAYDFFEAFCGIRDQLSVHDFYPLCYGASRCVYPSGSCAIWVQDWRHINCKWASQSVRKTSFISSKLDQTWKWQQLRRKRLSGLSG